MQPEQKSEVGKGWEVRSLGLDGEQTNGNWQRRQFECSFDTAKQQSEGVGVSGMSICEWHPLGDWLREVMTAGLRAMG